MTILVRQRLNLSSAFHFTDRTNDNNWSIMFMYMIGFAVALYVIIFLISGNSSAASAIAFIGGGGGGFLFFFCFDLFYKEVVRNYPDIARRELMSYKHLSPENLKDGSTFMVLYKSSQGYLNFHIPEAYFYFIDLEGEVIVIKSQKSLYFDIGRRYKKIEGKFGEITLIE